MTYSAPHPVAHGSVKDSPIQPYRTTTAPLHCKAGSPNGGGLHLIATSLHTSNCLSDLTQHDNAPRPPYHTPLPRLPWLPSNSQPPVLLHILHPIPITDHRSITSHTTAPRRSTTRQDVPKRLLVLRLRRGGVGQDFAVTSVRGETVPKGIRWRGRV